MEPDSIEIRVLGCLIEKQRATPDVYPLSLNALRLACNQTTNRDPVVSYDEETVVEALRRLALRGWTRLASSGSRARKYRHLLDDSYAPDETALLAVLMLRGTQTPGELKQRSERLHSFADLAAVHETLDRLIDREVVIRLDRRPGQKEDRYRHLLGGEDDSGSPPPERGEAQEEAAPTPSRGPVGPLEERIAGLEREVGELREQVNALREELGG